MRHLWVVEEDYQCPSGWVLLVDRGAFTTKKEATEVMRELREEADPMWDGPYRLAKYIREEKGGEGR